MLVLSVSGLVSLSALNAQPPVEYYYPNKPKVEPAPPAVKPNPPAAKPVTPVSVTSTTVPQGRPGGASDIYVGKRMPDGSVVVSVGGSYGGSYPYPSYSSPSNFPSSYSGSSYYGGGSSYPVQPVREPVYGSRDFADQYRAYAAYTDYLNSQRTGSYGVPSYGSSRPVTSYSGSSYPVGPVYSSGSYPPGTIIRR